VFFGPNVIPAWQFYGTISGLFALAVVLFVLTLLNLM
jgi:hypothetical protein